MRYLVAVADAGQLTEAARRLGVAQPTLSEALAQLEDQLGVVLLDRQPRGVRLTDAGAAFVARARRVLIAADEAVAGVRAMRRAGSQELLIGRDGLQPNGWSPLFLRLHREWPDAAIDWARLDFPVRGRSPLQHVDIALLTEPPPHPGLSELLLARQPRVALLSAGHRFAARAKVPVGDLLDEVYLGCDPSMEPAWLAFWSLDHERGGPPRMSEDRATILEEAIEIVRLRAGIRNRARPPYLSSGTPGGSARADHRRPAGGGEADLGDPEREPAGREPGGNCWRRRERRREVLTAPRTS